MLKKDGTILKKQDLIRKINKSYFDRDLPGSSLSFVTVKGIGHTKNTAKPKYFYIKLIAGGFVAAFQGLDVMGQVFIHILPIVAPAFKQAIEDYLASAHFIVGVFLIVLSSLGIYLSVKEKKVLYAVISAIVDLISIVSLISNFAACR